MTALRHRIWLRIAMMAAAWALAGCAGRSGNDMPGDGKPGGAPGTDIAVKVFPDRVPSPTGVTANADLVAFQDGEGDWTEVTGTGGIYHLAVTGDRYGVAVGCGGSFGGTEFYYQSVAEAGELAVNGCFRPVDTANVTVVVGAGMASGPNEIWIGGSLLFPGAGAAMTVMVEKGVQDVYARSYIPDIGGDLAVQVFRGPSLDVETDQTVTIDWAHALPAENLPLTISDPANAPGLWGVSSSYFTPHGQGFRPVQFSFGRASSYGAVPAAERQPGDLTRVEVSATGNPSSQGGPLPLRAAFQDMAIPAAVTLAPADYLSAAAPIIDLNAVSQLSVTLPIWKSKLGHTVSAASFRTQASIVPDHYLNMFIRPGWAGDKASVTLRVPDLRNLAGWTTDMELTGRAEVDWVLSVMDQDQPLDAPFGQDRIGVESMLSGKTVPRGVNAVTACEAPCAPRAVLRRSPFARRAP